MNPLEVWGGVECSVVRIGDRWRDNLRRSGHEDRIDDLDRFASLGLRAFRQPVLWERVAPRALDHADWSWTDARLERLRTLGMRPIVGLLHHGSGPASTNLLDPAFPEKLAAYARAVAERYPWVDAYTPVNEPLTTARFSALYGHWYPHQTSAAAFFRALAHQCHGTALAMRAIREVNPRAQLVQTEDFAHVTSTPALAHQAGYENERRWLSIDLLRGAVTPAHRFHAELLRGEVPRALLEDLRERPTPPDVLGLNYYVTSERFLDERLSLYPPGQIGGNGRQRYADVETVRVSSRGVVGHAGALAQTWDRFGLPLAFTEVHLGCTRDEQLRWLHEAWTACAEARARGLDVRAVTPWALLGSHDWTSLLVEERGDYEPGAFDVRGERPQATAVAGLVQTLARRASADHPSLDGRGWWRRASRLVHSPFPPAPVDATTTIETARVILLRGDDSALRRAVIAAARARDLAWSPATPRLAAGERQRAWAVVDLRGQCAAVSSLPALFLDVRADHAVLRASHPFSAGHRAAFAEAIARTSPVDLESLAHALLDLLVEGAASGAMDDAGLRDESSRAAFGAITFAIAAPAPAVPLHPHGATA